MAAENNNNNNARRMLGDFTKPTSKFDEEASPFLPLELITLSLSLN